MRKWIVLMALLASAVVLVAQQPTAQPVQNSSVVDEQIDQNAVDALGKAGTLTGVAINTSTSNGVVTLTGNVSDESQKALAEKMVRQAEGVKSVVNQLSIGKPQPAAATQTPMQPAPTTQPTAQRNNCDAEHMLSDGTCSATGMVTTAAGPMITVDVDQKCHVMESSGNSSAVKYRKDSVTCTMKKPKVSDGHIVLVVDGQLKRKAVMFQEQTYHLYNGSDVPIMYLVHVPHYKNWEFDSDPPPAMVADNVGTWRVIVQSGRTVSLHVGQRHVH